MKLRKGHWEPDAPAAANARRELPLFAAEYFTLGRSACHKKATAKKLHQFRLATKHFRYLLELFRPVYPSKLDDFLEPLRALQTLLGELNDYAVTRSLFHSARKKPVPEVQDLFTYLSTQEKQKRKEFRHFWNSEFDAKGEEDRWKSYLEHHAGRSARSAVQKPTAASGKPVTRQPKRLASAKKA